MPDEAIANQEQEHLKYLKIAHDNHATVCHILKTKPFFHEEFEGIQGLIAFYSELARHLKVKIEEIEPPKKEEKKPALVVEAN